MLRAASEALDVQKPAFTPSGTGASTPFTHQLNQRSRDWSPPSLSRDGSLSARGGGSRAPSPPITALTPATPGVDASKDTFPFPPYFATIDLIHSEHVKAARETVRDQTLLAELESEIEQDCYGLKDLLHAAQVSLRWTSHFYNTEVSALYAKNVGHRVNIPTTQRQHCWGWRTTCMPPSFRYPSRPSK